MNKLINIVLLSGFACMASTVAAEESFSAVVDADGKITLPEDFRKNMTHLGSWFVPTGDASGFHDVYLNKEAVDAYRETGKFPDGAVMIKELRHASSGSYTTGANVSFANDKVKQTFVMVKDSTKRFEGKNDNWGEGWGWALFKPGDDKTNLSTNYRNDCLGCHIPAKNNDWIYTEAYPTLAK